MGLGSLLFSLPHFLTGPYRYLVQPADNVIMILMPIMLVKMMVVVVVVEALLGGLYRNDVLQWR